MRIGGTAATSTWESASSLPSELIAEYEDGLQRELVDDSFYSGGETIHVLSSSPITPSAKRPRLDVSPSMNTGCVICWTMVAYNCVYASVTLHVGASQQRTQILLYSGATLGKTRLS